MIFRLAIVFILGLVATANSYAFGNLNIEITRGDEAALPIAVMDFQQATTMMQSQTSIASIIRNDLRNSGQFEIIPPKQFAQKPKSMAQVNFGYWRRLHADYLLLGSAKLNDNGNYTVKAQLVDIISLHSKKLSSRSAQQLVWMQQFDDVPAENLRSLAHHISDMVYQKSLGKRGNFATRIAYVVVEKTNNIQYYLEVADADGYGAQTLLDSTQPIMSPAWSPDGQELAYVSFENLRAEIYRHHLKTGKRELLAHYPGINGAPAWSPDGKKLALVLSKGGAPNIYVMDLQTKQLRQITRGYAKNTEPQWSTDGKSIYFTSNRGGTPQIYNVKLSNLKVKRVTYQGFYNARPRLTPDGNNLVVMHREKGEKKFNIGVLKIGADHVKLLSHTFLDESPTVSPNGEMVMYATYEGEQGILNAVSIDGKVHLRLPIGGGSVQEPAWSPFLH